MDLQEFSQKFAQIKAQGWVPSQRRGPTGIGHTFEHLLGLTENNIALPDLGKIEIKAHRIGATSLITLFTFNRNAWRMSPLLAVKKYGTPDSRGRLGLYFTLSRQPNSAGLFLDIESNVLRVRHISGEIITEWQIQDLAARFVQKIPALILVSALSETRGGVEWFKFERAQLLGETSIDIIRACLLSGDVVVDLRLHDKGTSARNHGTAFRTREDRLPWLFKSVTEL